MDKSTPFSPEAMGLKYTEKQTAFQLLYHSLKQLLHSSSMRMKSAFPNILS